MKQHARRGERGLGITPVAVVVWFPYVLIALVVLLSPVLTRVLFWIASLFVE